MDENMAHKHAAQDADEPPAAADIIDTVIDISEAVSEVAHPLENLANALVQEVGGSKNSLQKAASSSFCGAPGGAPAENEPANAPDPFLLYKTILQTAFTYERAYVVCARVATQAQLLPATGEEVNQAAPSAHSNTSAQFGPMTASPPNLIVVPCLAAVPFEVWLAALAEVPNIDIFLPPFSCNGCPANEDNVAEKTYAHAISSAEAAAGRGPGLVGKPSQMTSRHQRALKREHFVESVSRLPDTLIQGNAPQSFEEHAAARAEAAMANLHAFMRTLRRERSLATPPHEVPEDFNKTEAGSKKLIRPACLTKEQALLLATLHAHPALAENLALAYPVRNQALCTFCGACQEACPTFAIQFRRNNSFQVTREACRAAVGCNACERACPVHAIHYEACDAKRYAFTSPPAQSST